MDTRLGRPWGTQAYSPNKRNLRDSYTNTISLNTPTTKHQTMHLAKGKRDFRPQTLVLGYTQFGSNSAAPAPVPTIRTLHHGNTNNNTIEFPTDSEKRRLYELHTSTLTCTSWTSGGRSYEYPRQHSRLHLASHHHVTHLLAGALDTTRATHWNHTQKGTLRAFVHSLSDTVRSANNTFEAT